MKPDGWDLLGGGGMALLCAGVTARFGWPWAAMLLGAALVALYAMRELRVPRRG